MVSVPQSSAAFNNFKDLRCKIFIYRTETDFSNCGYKNHDKIEKHNVNNTTPKSRTNKIMCHFQSSSNILYTLTDPGVDYPVRSLTGPENYFYF